MKEFFSFLSEQFKTLAEQEFWTQISTVIGLLTFLAGIIVWFKKRGSKRNRDLRETIAENNLEIKQNEADIKKLKIEIEDKDLIISELRSKTIDYIQEIITEELRYNNEKRAFGIAEDYIKNSSPFYAECAFLSSKLEFSNLVSEWWHTSIKHSPGSEEDANAVELTVIDSSLRLDKILTLAETAKLITSTEKRFQSWESGIRLIHNLCTEYVSTNKLKVFALSEDRSAILGFNSKGNAYYAFGILNTLREALVENQILVQIELCKELYKFKSKVFGSSSPTALMEKSNLGYHFTEAGNYDEAIKILEDTLKKMEKYLGNDDILTGIVRGNLHKAKNKMKEEQTT